MATFSVEFSFNDIMNRQIDGVAMGSLRGPALDNIFFGYYETISYYPQASLNVLQVYGGFQ